MNSDAIQRADASVVIPAYNEEAVLARTLRTMLEGAAPGELEIIVACNGCVDRTAEIARGFGPDVRVVESKEASKTIALNMGDAAATRFPRFFIDADLEVSIAALRATAALVRQPGVLAAKPETRWDMRERPWVIRAFYGVWTKVPYFDDGLSGVYALSREGRARFGEFPRLISDDGFVDLQYAGGERRIARGVSFAVRPPADVGALLRMLTRIRAGSYELAQKYPEMAARRSVRAGETLRRAARDVRLWPAIPVYACLMALAKRRGRAGDGRGLDRVAARGFFARAGADGGGRVVSGAKRKRVLAVSSGGGHWIELMRLRPAFEGHDVAYVTVLDAYRADLDIQPGEAQPRFHVVNDATRWDKFGMVKLALRTLLILVRERPHVIVSTGALPGFFAIKLGRLLGARTIWLDSIANVEQLSMSGEKVGRSANLWLTQWPHLARPGGPVCEGAVL